MTSTAARLLFLLLSTASVAVERPFFAMDTGTKDAKHQTAEQQVALVKEIGFAGIGPIYNNPAGLRDMLASVDQHGLRLFAEYVKLDIDAAPPVSPEIRDTLEQLKGRDAFLWLYVVSKAHKSSDPAGDAVAVPLLREIARMAETNGVRVALYPHTAFWVERVEDGTRLARAVDRPNLGTTFNLCHWLKVDGQELEKRLEEAGRHLFVVTVNGADTAGKDWKTLIQPLDSGDFPVSRVLAQLDRMNYAGPVGLQHYGIGGDAAVNLRHSMEAWRRLTARPLLPSGTALEAWQPAPGWSEVGSVALDPQDGRKLVAEPGAGVILSAGKAGYLLTRDTFSDVEVHVEFMVPARSNSGVYVNGCHEVQILDSFGVEKSDYPGNECGGIYPEWVGNANVRGHTPKLNASLPAGQWQSFDIVYRAPRFDATGKKTANGCFVKVLHNGRIIHENVEVLGTTRSGLDEAAAGPLRLQGDHGPVAYRNIRVLPIPQN